MAPMARNLSLPRPNMTPTVTALSEPESHFAFGQNWLRFLNLIDEPRIEKAEQSFLRFAGAENLLGKSFLDIGCGSGLSSLVACRCGMSVTAFDYDADAVNCSTTMRNRF